MVGPVAVMPWVMEALKDSEDIVVFRILSVIVLDLSHASY